MKRFGFTLVEMLAVCAVVAVVASLAPAARAQTPVTMTFALPAGASAATNSYAAGIAQPANTSFRVTALEFAYAGTADTNGTITVAKTAGGPSFLSTTHTVSGAAYKGVAFESNTWFVRRGDFPTVAKTLTNACSVVLHGLEQ